MRIWKHCAVAMACMAFTPAFAQQPTAFACTGDGAPKYETGLGESIDDLVHIPSRLRSNMHMLQGEKWSFEYGDGSFTYRDKRLVTIRKGASDLNMTAQFSHEIGHANYAYKEDTSSRDAYVRRA